MRSSNNSPRSIVTNLQCGVLKKQHRESKKIKLLKYQISGHQNTVLRLMGIAI